MSGARHDEILLRLPEYHEGTLTAEERHRVEAHLNACPVCAERLASIAAAFELLGRESDLPVPAHYFATLLPRIRHRLEGSAGTHRRTVPYLVEGFLRPLAAAAVVACIAVLYGVLKPIDELAPLRLVVAQVPAEELSSLGEQVAAGSTDLTMTDAQWRPIETSGTSSMSLRVDRELAIGAIEHDETVEQTLEGLSDQEVGRVLAHLALSTSL